MRNPTSGQWFPAAADDARAYHAMVAVTIGGKSVALAIGGQTSSFLSSTTPALKGADYYEPPAIKAMARSTSPSATTGSVRTP